MKNKIYILCPRLNGGVLNASIDLDKQLKKQLYNSNIIIGWPKILRYFLKLQFLDRNSIIVFNLETVFFSIFFRNSIFWMHGFPNRNDMGFMHYLWVKYYYFFGIHFSSRSIAVSSLVQQFVSAEFGCKNIFISHNCYKRLSIKKINKKGPIKFIYIGRLIEKKGILFSIDLLKDLPNIKFDIYGSGPLKDDVINLCNKFEHISYKGEISRIKLLKLMNSYDINILPSNLEPCAMSVCETAAHGCFQLISRYSGASEFITALNFLDTDMSKKESLISISKAIKYAQKGFEQKIQPINEWKKCFESFA